MIRLFQVSAVLVAGAIIFLSVKSIGVPSATLHADKINHFIAYAVLTGLIAMGWPKLRPMALVAVAFCFGVSLELVQGAMDLGRTASLLDALANLAGASFAALLFFFVRKK